MASFINCRKAVEFTGTESDGTVIKHRIPAGFIGTVPPWVERHWYYKLLCGDGTIATVARGREDDPGERAAADAARAEAEARAERKRKVDGAKEAARVEAEKLAEERGLDSASAKKLVAETVRAAEEKALADFSKL